MENHNSILYINQNNIQKEKQKYGYYSEGFFNQDDKKYLIKKPNLNGHINNEVYLMSIIREILGSKDSISVKFAYLANNQEEKNLKKIFKANQDELKEKIRIASLWIEETKNLMEAQIDFQKKPKNLIKVLFTSLLINNIDPNPGNILADKENKFYLIDPLVISEQNRYDVNAKEFYSRINNFYQEFLNDLKKDNIKEKIQTLLTSYFSLYYNIFFLKIKKVIETKYSRSNLGHILFLDNIDSCYKKISEIIDNNRISNFIDLMNVEEIYKEIEDIKNSNHHDLKKIAEFYESEENFPGFGSSGIQKGHINIILNRLEQLSKSPLFTEHA